MDRRNANARRVHRRDAKRCQELLMQMEDLQLANGYEPQAIQAHGIGRRAARR